MRSLRFLAVFALAAACTGCANLRSVQAFAVASARFSAYTEVTTRFRDTYRREQPYLSGQAEELARANDRHRKAAYQDLLRIQQNVALYMQTLARLAGDRTFDLSKPLETAASGIQAHPDLGIDAKQVQACAKLAEVVAKWLTAAYQERAVRELLREGEPELQILLAGMASLVSHYQQTNETERRSVLGLLEIELPFADTPQERLLATLVKAHLQAKQQEYQRADALYGEAARGILDMQEGHRALVEQAGRLSSQAARTAISGFTQDLQAIRTNLQPIQAM